MSEASEPSIIDQVRTRAGGTVALAAALSLSGVPIRPQAISQWTRVPAERCLDVERLTGISRHVLRPDVFGAAQTDGVTA
jgi:DNA-binding transcriptional regulator YdaS (Cro superfamily)